MNEERIIEYVLNGETEMFRLLVERYHERVFILSRGFVHSREDAEDVTQDTFLKAYISLGDFSGRSEFSTWLFRICINTSLSQVKKKNKRFFLVEYSEKLKSFLEQFSHDKSETPYSILSEKERREIIYKEIDKLTEKQKIAFVLSRLEELSQKEIAKIMMISEHAVESLIQRANKQLKNKLKSIIDEKDNRKHDL
ncbi:MAG: RNA polymerase sigma factor [Bacteroidales bacterium]